MASVGSRIKDRRKKLGLTVDEVAMKLGKNRATVYRYESNDIENMPATVLEPLAEILDTTPAFLLGYDNSSNTKVDLSTIPNIIPLPDTKKVPLLGKIACGDPITAVENIDDYVEVPDDIQADFALTCQGDSMINARVMDGDIVYVRQQPEVENGEIAAVLIDGEATLKRVFYGKGTIMLQAENPTYPPMVFSGEEILDVKILGKATYFLSKVK